MKDYYLNHCGLCRIRFKELDENMKLGMIQNIIRSQFEDRNE